jgi:DNA-binding beta-propeller fold protein YncE
MLAQAAPPASTPGVRQLALLQWGEAIEGADFPEHTATALAFDGDHIWVANNNSGDVTKLRAYDGAHLATVPTGPGSRGIAFDGANVWVANVGVGIIGGTVSKR